MLFLREPIPQLLQSLNAPPVALLNSHDQPPWTNLFVCRIIQLLRSTKKFERHLYYSRIPKRPLARQWRHKAWGLGHVWNIWCISDKLRPSNVFHRGCVFWCWNGIGEFWAMHTWDSRFFVLSDRISAWAYLGVQGDSVQVCTSWHWVPGGTAFCQHCIGLIPSWRNTRGREPWSAGEPFSVKRHKCRECFACRESKNLQ